MRWIFAACLLMAGSGMAIEKSILSIAVPSKIGSLNPVDSLKAQDKFTLSLVYEPLWLVDSDQQIKPVLAQTWTPLPEGKGLRISLRRDRVFSDGTPITAKAVELSFRRLCETGSKGATDVAGLPGCAALAVGKEKTKEPLGFAVVDDYTFDLQTSFAPNNFVQQLATGRVVITRSANHRLIGSGPYVIQSLKPEELVLAKNHFYHSPEQVKNDGIRLTYVSEDKLGDKINAGVIDGGIMYLQPTVGHVNAPGISKVEYKPYITQTLVLNRTRPPFNQPEFRKKLAQLIRDESGVEACASPVTKAYGIIPIGLGGSIAGQAPTATEGNGNVKKFPKTTMTIHRHRDRKNDCDEAKIVAAAKKLNCEIKFRYHDDYPTLWPLYLNHNLDGFIELLAYKNREALSIFQFFQMSSPEHFFNFDYPDLDPWIDMARKAQSASQRYSHYRNIAKMVQEDGWVIPLYYLGHGDVFRKCIKGVPQDVQASPSSFHRLPMLWWDKSCG